MESRYTLNSIRGQNVLVTGGSGAIGKAIANAFFESGANVYLWGHRETDGVDKYSAYQIVELEDEDEITKALERLPDNIDTLVNCAGYTKGNKSEEYTLEDWEKTVRINLSAPFLLSQKIAKRMIPKGKGSIINITSINAEQGFPGNPAYVASKGGLKMLAKGFACDWAQYGIRVNNVGPGYTRTKMTQGSWNDPVLHKQRSDRMMLDRWGKPEDIAGVVLFLASDLAEYVTGQDIYVDGGWTAKGL